MPCGSTSGSPCPRRSKFRLAAAPAARTFSGVIASLAVKASTQVEKPDPVAVGRLEEAGVADPERVLNDLIESSVGDREDDRAKRAVAKDEGETPPDEDAGKAAVQQQGSMTPASEPTEKAGS